MRSLFVQHRHRHPVRLHRLTSWAEGIYLEVRTFQTFDIYTGYYLIDLMLMGAIVGVWKKKPDLLARKLSEDQSNFRRISISSKSSS